MDPEHIKSKHMALLKKFASNIELHESLKGLTKADVQMLIDRRNKDVAAEFETDELEKMQSSNVLSFFYFAIDEKEEAKRLNDESLKMDNRNINALSCRVYYHLEWGEFYESKQWSTELETLNPNHLERLTSEAEVAYAFTKIGIKHFPIAIEKFESILGKVSEIPDVPESYICLWKFSLALTIRRQLNAFCSSEMQHPTKEEANSEKVKRLYEEIISMESTDVINRYRARACVDIALEVYYKEDRKNARNERPSSSGLKNHQEIEEYITRALQIEPDDDFVLSRSGKYYRLTKNLTKSTELLRKALDKKETSFSHHHIALALQNLIYQRQRQDAVILKNDDVTEVADQFARGVTLESNSTSEFKPTTLTSRPRQCFTKVHGQSSSVDDGHKPWQTNQHEQPAASIGQRTKPYTSEENFKRKLMKSPRKLQFISKDEPEYTHIMYHLDRAYSLNDNIPALYDKGLICRAAKQYADAIAIFKKMFGLGSITSVLLADAYEQAAMCLLEETESKPDDTERNEHDAKCYLTKSLGITSELVMRNSDLKRSWGSSPALRTLLLQEPRTLQNLRETANFFRMVRNSRQAIDIFENILKRGIQVDELKDDILNQVKTCLRDDDHDGAILALNLLPLENATNEILTLYFEVYIKGGITACLNEEPVLARKNLKSAFDAIKTDDQSNQESTTDPFDIFILSSDSSEEMAIPLCTLLKTLGLRVTVNSDDVMPGQLKERTMDIHMGSSKCIAVFLAAEEDDRDIKILQQRYTKGDRRIIVSESERHKRDPMYSKLPAVSFERTLFVDIGRVFEFESLTREQISWVETLLLTIPV